MFKKIGLAMQKRQALNAFASGDFESARTLFLRILETEKESPGYGWNAGLASMALKDYEQAEYYLKRELELFGPAGDRLKALGDLYFMTGNRESALKYYDDALEHFDHDKWLVRRLEQCADEAVFADAQESLTLYDKGRVHMADEDIDEAEECFGRAVELDHSNFAAWNELGVCALNFRCNPEKAAESFEKALEFTDLPAVRRNLAEARRQGG